MGAIDCIERIANTSLINYNLKYCLVSSDKKPFKISGELAKPNCLNDFVELDSLLQCDNLIDYAGVGISIQSSNICAIDVDKCFSEPNVFSSIDDRGQKILELFKDIAYCEFSFSGTGLRIIFLSDVIDDYSNQYYIKNEKNKIEYYQPSNSFRYVTLTGNKIYDHFSKISINKLIDFLELYMKKPERKKRIVQDIPEITLETSKKKIKYLYLTNHSFQDLWFSNAPGSGKDESERDFKILLYIYENITRDPKIIKELFETSPYYLSKDEKHIYKWKYQDGRYFNYIFNQISRLI